MNEEAKALYYFAIQTIFEKDDFSLDDLKAGNEGEKQAMRHALYCIRNFCIDAADIANKPIGNEVKE